MRGNMNGGLRMRGAPLSLAVPTSSMCRGGLSLPPRRLKELKALPGPRPWLLSARGATSGRGSPPFSGVPADTAGVRRLANPRNPPQKGIVVL